MHLKPKSNFLQKAYPPLHARRNLQTGFLKSAMWRRKKFSEAAASWHSEYGENSFQEVHYLVAFNVYCTLAASLQHLASICQDGRTERKEIKTHLCLKMGEGEIRYAHSFVRKTKVVDKDKRRSRSIAIIKTITDPQGGKSWQIQKQMEAWQIYTHIKWYLWLRT